jgi:hypothetical protein
VGSIDLNPFSITKSVSKVHSFALQEGDRNELAMFHEGIYREVSSFFALIERLARLSGYDALNSRGSILSAVLRMAEVRLNLKAGHSLTFYDLTTLIEADPEELRSSLIAEGLREPDDDDDMMSDKDLITPDDFPEDEDSPDETDVPTDEEGSTDEPEGYWPPEIWSLDAASSEAWLKRHGIPPTLLPEDMGLSHAPEITELLRTSSFSEAMDRMVILYGFSARKLAGMADVNEEWLSGLIEGKPVAADLEALERVAKCLDLDAPLFVDRAVAAIRSTTSDSEQVGNLQGESSGNLESSTAAVR